MLRWMVNSVLCLWMVCVHQHDQKLLEEFAGKFKVKVSLVRMIIFLQNIWIHASWTWWMLPRTSFWTCWFKHNINVPMAFYHVYIADWTTLYNAHDAKTRGAWNHVEPQRMSWPLPHVHVRGTCTGLHGLRPCTGCKALLHVLQINLRCLASTDSYCK